MDCGVMAELWDYCAVMAYLCHSGGVTPVYWLYL